MIASYTAPSALVQTVRPCKGTWILWSRSSAWGMKFNTKKCQIMSIGSGKSHPTYLHNLCGHVLSSVQIAKYLYAVPVRCCTCTLLVSSLCSVLPLTFNVYLLPFVVLCLSEVTFSAHIVNKHVIYIYTTSVGSDVTKRPETNRVI